MNYPVWYVPALGGPLIIAMVAIIHVVVSHFAVGGGLWLVLTEKKAYNEKNEFILDYVKKHTMFFMLLTMVLGALTGVGIWFTIALINPDATSSLIHSFVFGWAIEWVFFVIEIVTAFLYFYTFKKVPEKTHLLIGWIYFIAAWISLFIINGILAFMITPGKWLQTQNFWDGFLNPSSWPSLVFRTFLCFALAGSYALLTASKKFSGEKKEILVKYNGKWILYSIPGMIISLVWYYFSLPVSARKGLAGASYIMKVSLAHLVIALVVFLFLLFLFILWKAKKLSFSGSIVVLLTIFVFFGAFEFIREAGRKPYAIFQYMYATGVKVSKQEKLKNTSVLQHARWVQTREITGENELKAGEELFRIQCYACHSFGIKNNINGKLEERDLDRITRNIGNLSGITPFMPAFVGSEAEKTALAKWLYSITHKGKEITVAEAVGTPGSPSGEAVFNQYCADCHESGSTLKSAVEKYKSLDEISEILGKLEELSEDMPPFEGTPGEKKALAQYLYELRSEK